MKRTPTLVISTALAIGFAALAPTAVAQDQADEGVSGLLEEVIVTARKREETLQEIPVSITVFNQDAIRQADIRNLENVGELTPGFQFVNQGNQQPGRYNTQLQFRGLTTAQFSPSFATGALFIDGIYVLNGGTSLSLMDIDRVEVIKGPQAAYFGRNTFGGAVNLITRDPNMSAWAGEFTGAGSDRSNYDFNFILEGPIVTDTLSVSISGRYYDKKGHYVASDGGRLGDEQTTSFNGVAKWQATEELSFKFRYGYSEDDDGAPASAFASGIINDSCTGKVIDSPDGPAMPTRYICGQVPDRNSLLTDGGVISSNTILPPYVIAAGLTNPETNVPGVPDVSEVGLKRETTRYSLFANYDFANDYSVSFSYGHNEQDTNWIRDFDLTDRIAWFSRDPQKMEDTSYELRLVSPQDQRLRWLVGANYYEQEFFSSGGGGDATTSCFSLVPGLTDAFPEACLGGAPGFTLLFANALQNTDEASVTGFFGSIDFDISEQFTFILEGRFVEDELTKGGGLTTPGAPLLSETYDDFLPRAILRWTPSDATNVFLSYSEGQIAGDFNTFYINADDRERAQYNAQDPRIAESLDAETLKGWEIGWKQAWAEGRIQTNIAYYNYEWKNIKGRSSFQINETCRAGDIGVDPACDPANGQMTGDPKATLGPDGQLIPFINSRNILLPGNADVQGIELEASWAPTDDMLVQYNLSWIDSEYTDYEFNFVAPIAGFAQMAGSQTPRQPKTSSNLAFTKYFDAGRFPAYVRFDYVYQGRAYVDESNLAFIDSYGLIHLRGGVNTDNWLVELFIRNLADEDAWATGARWTDFSSPTQFAFLTAKQGVALTPLDRREVGVRVNYRF